MKESWTKKNPKKNRVYQRTWAQNNKEKLKAYQKKFRVENALRACMYCKAMRLRKVNRALGLPYNNISIDDLLGIYNKQKGLCALTGRKMKLFASSTDLDAISVDRIKREPGYRLRNLRFVTNQVNSARATGNDAQLLQMCRDVIRVLGKKK